MTTKEKIIDESLTLFSKKGFKGTSVKDIADAVGIKDSSLYKHFASKQQILNSIIDLMQTRINSMSNTFGLPIGDDLHEAAKVYATFSEANLIKLSKEIFLFYLKDSIVSRFWRMGTIEQYQNPEVYSIFSKFFLEDSITYQTELFTQMIKEKIFINRNPQVMAIYFYTPIFFLLSKYTNLPDKEDEAISLLENQVREFCTIYKLKK